MWPREREREQEKLNDFHLVVETANENNEKKQLTFPFWLRRE